MQFFCAGRSGAALRKAIRLQASPVNVCAALGSRFSGESQGTSNEPNHRSANNSFKFPKGSRKLELLEHMLQIGVVAFNGAQFVFPFSGTRLCFADHLFCAS